MVARTKLLPVLVLRGVDPAPDAPDAGEGQK